MKENKLIIFFGILAVAIFATSAATGYGFFNSILALAIFLGFWYIVSRLSSRSVKEEARLGKILKDLWSIGRRIGVKDDEETADKRHYSSDQLSQIELWVELISKHLMR